MRYRYGAITFFLLTTVLCLFISQAGAAIEKNPLKTKHILLLNSYHQRMTWVKDIVRGVEDILQPEKNGLSLHVENMDSKKQVSPNLLDPTLLVID
jgi:hypothetical protein